MNIILFHPHEVELPLPRHDPRAGHILDVLRREAGGTFDAGLINGPRGRGTLFAITAETLALSFVWTDTPPPPNPLHLLIGLPRPQTARDILRDATTLGVASLHFIRTEKGEASYARSSLWQTGEWERHVIAGAEQAFCTRLPEVTHAARSPTPSPPCRWQPTAWRSTTMRPRWPSPLATFQITRLLASPSGPSVAGRPPSANS